MEKIVGVPLVWDNILDRLCLIKMSLVSQQFRQSAINYVYSRRIIINDLTLLKNVKWLRSALRSMRLSISRWLDAKDSIIELVNRSSFERLELIIFNNANCDDLLFTIESNANLRLKLKALVQRYNIHRPIYFENWKVKAKDPELLKSDEFFLRLLNVTQGLEEFRFDIVRECTPTGLGYNRNVTKNEEYPALFANFNPERMKILSYICNVPCQHTLMPILVKCGPTLKHLRISNWGGYHIPYPIDEILSLCPKLLSLDASSCIIQTDNNSSDSELSLARGRNSPIYPLRYFHDFEYQSASVKSWLIKHCPNLKPNKSSRVFNDHYN